MFSVNSTCHFVEVSVHRFRREIKDEKNHLKIIKQVFLRLTMIHNPIYEALTDERIHKYGREELQSKELLSDRNCRYMLNKMAFSRRKTRIMKIYMICTHFVSHSAGSKIFGAFPEK